MAEYGLDKNCEGYADPTAYAAIMGAAKPGEIWVHKDRECLIVKNQGKYSNILQLKKIGAVKKKESITVAGQWEANPGMLSYAFNDQLSRCVDACTLSEWKNIREEIEAKLGMNLSSGEETEPSEEDVMMGEILVLEEVKSPERENTELKAKLELLQGMYNDLLQRAFAK